MSNAFKTYLTKIPEDQAIRHIYECLTGPDGEAAWELMAETHGEDWSCSPAKLGQHIKQAIDSLKGLTNEQH